MSTTIFAWVFAVFLLATGSLSEPELVISKLERQIDLQTHAARYGIALRVENIGDTPTDQFTFLIPSHQLPRLAFIKASILQGKGKDRTGVPTEVTKSPTSPSAEYGAFSVKLSKDLVKGSGSASIEVFYIVTGAVTPFPAEITQSEPQLLVFVDNHVVLTPYSVKHQSTVVKLPNTNVESYTRREPVKVSGNELKLGPYEKATPLEVSPLQIHYENNRPLAQVKTLEREIEISHWGNIYVTEKYFLTNAGAKHKGSFSRFEYQSQAGSSAASALRGLIAQLPAHVHSAYYRDEIGNISTSHLRSDLRKSVLEIEPRYPLLGGWSVSFTIGYSVPLEDFLFQASDGRRGLNFAFGSPFPEVVVDRLTVKVVLPEGSSDYNSFFSYPVEEREEVKYTYLDTVGRPVVVLEKNNVVAEIALENFQVLYSFPTPLVLVEPLLLVAAIFFFFLSYIIYLRLDFTISKNTPSYLARQQEEQVAYAIQRLQKTINQRSATFEKLDKSLAQVARTGDTAAAKAARKAAEASLKDSSKDLKLVVDELEAASGKVALPLLPKVQALLAKEKERQAQSLLRSQIFVESYEKKLSSKEIDERVHPAHQKYVALNKEVKGLLAALDV